MTLPTTEHTFRSERHTTGYLACGAQAAPLLIFVHGWPELGLWNIAAQHPQKTIGVASLCVPFLAAGFTLETMLPLVDRTVYPEAEYPAGQWDYQLFYEESFDQACKELETDIRKVVKAMFRKGDPNAAGRPSRMAGLRKAGGWFGGGACPDLPRDADIISEADLEAYTAALARNGLFGPCSWYMNHKANGAYARTSKNERRLSMPVLFLHGAYDTVCETMTSGLAGPMRRDCADLTEVVVKSGHWMAQENPVAVNAALAKWLAARLPAYWTA